MSSVEGKWMKAYWINLITIIRLHWLPWNFTITWVPLPPNSKISHSYNPFKILAQVEMWATIRWILDHLPLKFESIFSCSLKTFYDGYYFISNSMKTMLFIIPTSVIINWGWGNETLTLDTRYWRYRPYRVQYTYRQDLQHEYARTKEATSKRSENRRPWSYLENVKLVFFFFQVNLHFTSQIGSPARRGQVIWTLLDLWNHPQ